MRYLPLSDQDRKGMLAKIGVSSVNDLYQDIPDTVWLKESLDLPDHQGEIEVEFFFSRLANNNIQAGSVPFFVGAGAYRHHVPASVDHLIQRGEYLTSYTPYQPEISQGTLQCLFEFQTQVTQISDLDVANASLYDGSTATAEAILMAQRITGRNKVLISGNLHPHYREVAKTTTRFTDNEILPLGANAENPANDMEALVSSLDETVSCVVVQNPDVFGHLQDLRTLADRVHNKGALLIVVVTEVISLGAIMPPGEMGADIMVAEGQSLGNGLNFGGPYLGLMATRQKYVRQMPGRICGQTIDNTGKRGYVLTLSTREQHIRREKATSNICTNSGLTALAFSIHLSLLGEKGFTHLAMLNHKKAVQLKTVLESIKGLTVLNRVFFNELAVLLPKPAAWVTDQLAGENILAGVPASRLFPEDKNMENILILAATEMTQQEHLDALKISLTRACS